jgi:TRAP-type C4-dicarboxylate transport system permease small subunit
MGQANRAATAVDRALHYVAGALIIAVMALTVYNILGRWLFNEPFRGTVELTQLAMLGIVYLGMAYAQDKGNHIAVDLLYNKMPTPVRVAMDWFATLLSLAILAALAWQLYKYSQVLDRGGRVTASRGIPLFPAAYVGIVGIAAFALAFVRSSIDRVRAYREGNDAPDDIEQVLR